MTWLDACYRFAHAQCIALCPRPAGPRAPLTCSTRYISHAEDLITAHQFEGKWPEQTYRMSLRSCPAYPTNPQRRERSATDAGTYVISSARDRHSGHVRVKIRWNFAYFLKFLYECRRPSTVCVCSCFPSQPIPIQTRVLILQHPNEVRWLHGRLR